MGKVHLAVGISISILLAGASYGDDLVSLDGQADQEVALDLGMEDSFTPYNFARTNAWGFLPIGALILVGLHLFRVPKRKSKRKIDQARRFFRGISGEGTNTSILTSPKGENK